MSRFRSLRRVSCLSLPLVVALLLSTPAAALDARLGLRASAWLEDADPALGIEGNFPVGDGRWEIVPNGEIVFGGDRDRWVASIDLHRFLPRQQELRPYLGAGLTFVHREGRRGFDDEDDAGINLLGGVEWRRDRWTPFAQLKVVAADDAEAVASIGIRF